MANKERNRGLGLTRAEGKELDELREQYPWKLITPSRVSERIRAHLALKGTLLPEARVKQAAAGIAPDSEMEDLAEKRDISFTENLKEVVNSLRRSRSVGEAIKSRRRAT
jgi:hypothetical protein